METIYWIEIRRHGNDAYFMTTCRNDDSPIKEFMVVNSCLFKSFLIDDSIDIDRQKRFAAYQIYFNEIPNIPNSRITKKRHPIELLSYCFDPEHDANYNFDGDCGYPVDDYTVLEHLNHGGKPKGEWTDNDTPDVDAIQIYLIS